MSIVLERLGKRYGRFCPWVLHEIDLTLPKGSRTVISGANGSGKSTLLCIIAGISAPTTGAVQGRPARVALIPDRFVPPARMTARSYLQHHGRIRGLSASQASKRASELAEELSIIPGTDIYLADLSKGNTQKVAVAQAFMTPVDLLVLDEARTALDAASQRVLTGLLDAATDKGTTIVISDPVNRTCYGGANQYELVGGRIERVSRNAIPSDESVTVRLRARRKTAAREGIGRIAAAVVDDMEDLVIFVPARRSDELLRVALRDGWRVLEVHQGAQG